MISEMGKTALYQAKHIHDRLGKLGETIINKNQYEEQAMLADIEAEKAVIDTLEKYQLPATIVSEEHGVIQIGDTSPAYIALLDGLDGSHEYKKNRGIGRYGTMLGIFSGPNPRFSDYIFCGVMEHSANTIYFGMKNQGSYRLHTQLTKIHCSKQTILSSTNTRFYIDEEYDYR